MHYFPSKFEIPVARTASKPLVPENERLGKPWMALTDGIKTYQLYIHEGKSYFTDNPGPQKHHVGTPSIIVYESGPITGALSVQGLHEYDPQINTLADAVNYFVNSYKAGWNPTALRNKWPQVQTYFPKELPHSEVIPERMKKMYDEQKTVLPDKSSQTMWHTYTRDEQGNKVEVKVNQPAIKDASLKINFKRMAQIDLIFASNGHFTKWEEPMYDLPTKSKKAIFDYKSVGENLPAELVVTVPEFPGLEVKALVKSEMQLPMLIGELRSAITKKVISHVKGLR